MKIIFSRKGFDSKYGKVASPIFPGGRLLSLSIPSIKSNISFKDIVFDNKPLSGIVGDLTKGRIPETHRCHLDPDLRKESLKRKRGWRPAFGQVEQAQSHLSRQGVKEGDIFLFYGWFRQIIRQNNQWVFKKDAPDVHLFHGWLQIGETHKINRTLSHQYPWLSYHPHFHGHWGKNNTIYIAAKSLKIDSIDINLNGAGSFPYFKSQLQLTAQGHSRSYWRLPAWFYPAGRKSALTYNTNFQNWLNKKNYVILKSAPIGQEFILDTDDYPEAIEWLKDILSCANADSE